MRKKAERPSTSIQTLILSKDKFESAEAAKKWAREHGFRDDKVDENEDSYRLRQQDPGEFTDDSFRTITLKPGVEAVIGRPKAASAEDDNLATLLNVEAALAREVMIDAVRKSPVLSYDEELAKAAKDQDLIDDFARADILYRNTRDANMPIDEIVEASAVIFDEAKRRGLTLAQGTDIEQAIMNRRQEKPKAAGVAFEKSIVAHIEKIDDERRIFYALAMVPDLEDTQGDVCSAEEIERAAHDYLIHSRIVGDRHERVARAEVVESFIAPVDFMWATKKVLKGSWVMGIHVSDDVMWKEIKNGTLNSLSIGGMAERVDA